MTHVMIIGGKSLSFLGKKDTKNHQIGKNILKIYLKIITYIYIFKTHPKTTLNNFCILFFKKMMMILIWHGMWVLGIAQLKLGI